MKEKKEHPMWENGWKLVRVDHFANGNYGATACVIEKDGQLRFGVSFCSPLQARFDKKAGMRRAAWRAAMQPARSYLLLKQNDDSSESPRSVDDVPSRREVIEEVQGHFRAMIARHTHAPRGASKSFGWSKATKDGGRTYGMKMLGLLAGKLLEEQEADQEAYMHDMPQPMLTVKTKEDSSSDAPQE